jgi:hypothetical protein
LPIRLRGSSDKKGINITGAKEKKRIEDELTVDRIERQEAKETKQTFRCFFQIEQLNLNFQNNDKFHEEFWLDIRDKFGLWSTICRYCRRMKKKQKNEEGKTKKVEGGKERDQGW